MIIKVAKHGHSFKGAAAYYLHDKTEANTFNRHAGNEQTAERVEFTETRNLATDNPDTAWKVMAATAMDSEHMKQQTREAEGKRSQASGNTQASSVYSFSVAWHPDEQGKITREDMTTAAEDALERLGLQDHQALFVAHNDTDHPHIHVMVNKANPETGINAKLWNDYNKLDKFAADYREQRNEQHYCPDRAKKWLNHENGESNKNRQKQTGARLDKGDHAALNANTPEAAAARKQNARDGNRLSDAATRMKEKHAQQWERFKSNNRTAKEAIYDRYKTPMADARERLNTAKQSHAEIKDAYKQKTDRRLDEIKAKHRPAMSQLGKQQWKDKRTFERHEQTLQGIVGHAISAAITNRKYAPEKSKGFVRDTARMIFNTSERHAAFDKRQQAQFAETVSKPMRQEMNEARKAIRAEQTRATAHTVEAMGAAVADMKNLNNHRAGELEMQKAAQATAYTGLKGNQQADRKRLQKAWGSLKARRNEAITALRTRTERKQDQKQAHQGAFKEAAKDEAKQEATKKTRTRNRSKERKPRQRGKSWRIKPE